MVNKAAITLRPIYDIKACIAGFVSLIIYMFILTKFSSFLLSGEYCGVPAAYRKEVINFASTRLLSIISGR